MVNVAPSTVANLLDNVEACVDQTLAAVGKELVIATPLGLGKPVQLINAFYNRALKDNSISLHILTALSLEVPKPGSEIEANLSDPILERLFGDYEELAYVAPFSSGSLPKNIRVTEYYFRAGSHKGHALAQQRYVSSNYTHIVRDMCGEGVNVLAQMVAAREIEGELSLSLSCNTDLTLELIERAQAKNAPLQQLAQVHEDLPYMEGEAEFSPQHWDAVIQHPSCNKTLFAVPNAAVPLQDYATGLHASSLIADGGTLQIGIGSLGDAVAHACILRQNQNEDYRTILQQLTLQKTTAADEPTVFEQGLYVSTEMFVNGMMHLIEHGVVKRKVYDNLLLQHGLNEGRITEQVDDALFSYGRECGLIPQCLTVEALGELQHWGIIGETVTVQTDALKIDGEGLPNDTHHAATRAALIGTAGHLKNGRILHGGFFLGPQDFYDKLNALSKEQQDQIRMTGVSRTNQLLLDYPLYSAQRRDARFINTGMMVSLSGAVASDALEDGTVISGVGGQYNFVAMAHDLPGARSVLCIRSTRGQGSSLKSNIVPFYGHATVPKHLRDIVVTEYGVADLRGQNDAQIIMRLLNVTDSRFQSSLLEYAKEQKKVPRDYRIPAWAQNNTPERLSKILEPFSQSGHLPDYPFGTAMTEQELALAASLRKIKALSEEPAHFMAKTVRALLHRDNTEAAKPFLERVKLDHPETTREFLMQQLLLLELEERGLLKVS